MAIKVRTGFEVLKKQSGGGYFTINEFNNLAAFGENLLVKAVYLSGSAAIGSDTTSANLYSDYFKPGWYSSGSSPYLHFHAHARTKITASNKGCVVSPYHGQRSAFQFDATQFQEGFHAKYFFINGSFYLDDHSGSATKGFAIGTLHSSSGNLACWVGPSSDGDVQARKIYLTDSDGTLITESSDKIVSAIRYKPAEVVFSINNDSVLEASYNGIVLNYDLKNLSWVTNSGFSQWETINTCGISTGDYIDDLAINDGSGGSDDSIPNAIRGIMASHLFYFDSSSTLVDNPHSADFDEVEVLSDWDTSTFLKLNKGGSLKLNIDTSITGFRDEDGNDLSASDFSKISAFPIQVMHLKGATPAQQAKLKIESPVSSYMTNEVSFGLNLTNFNKTLSSSVNWAIGGPYNSYSLTLDYLN